MPPTSQTVACIGLGRMGSGIAGNIQKAGFGLVVYNRTPEKTQPFVAAGATAARSPREAVAAADFVVTSLMDDRSVLDSVTGESGILTGMRPDAIHIGTTTISPNLSARLSKLHSEHGTNYLAAPVAGRPDWAASGKLLTFVAGKPEVVERARPVLQSYTAEITVVGEDHAVASSMKLAGNFFIACLLETLGQTFVFAEKRGVNPEAIAGMFKAFIPHPGLQHYMDNIRTRNFDGQAGFTLEGGLKDVQLMLDAAAEAQMPLPFAGVIRDHCITALAHGMKGSDWSAFTEALRIDAGQK
jgi:3-hydroxyisobutyrate dehydrogenase-like beta-hydroxyacid dehydrogenase